MESLIQAEGAILLWIQEVVRSDVMTIIMTGITSLNYKGIIWILVTVGLLANKRTRRLGAMCAVALFCGLLVTNVVIKNWVARVRPYEVIEGLESLVGIQPDFSFPSGHTTSSLACTTVLLMRGPKKWGIAALILSILIALSRLYLGVHYPTDVLCGVAVGIFSGLLAVWLVPKLEQRFPKLKKMIEM